MLFNFNWKENGRNFAVAIKSKSISVLEDSIVVFTKDGKSFNLKYDTIVSAKIDGEKIDTFNQESFASVIGSDIKPDDSGDSKDSSEDPKPVPPEPVPPEPVPPEPEPPEPPEPEPEPEPRDIWVKVKFLNKSYNPIDHQLATGTACTREDDYGTNERNKKFAADWQLINEDDNIWLWGVTEGTNLAKAFGYGSYDGLGSSLFIDENFDQTMPEDLKITEGANIYSEAASWRAAGYGLPSNIEYTGKVEIVDWNLEEATDLDGFIGTNLWYDIPVYGKLPSITTKAYSLTYAFNRLFHITEVGDITINSGAQPALINAFYTMTSLTKFPNITANNSVISSNAFRGCCNVSKDSIESTYELLNGYIETYGKASHANTFTLCGVKQDETALDNIPSDWGGKA